MIDGVPTYSMTFGSGSAKTVITVDITGNPATLPTHGTTTYGDASVPALASAALQTLATADGVTGTIASTQTLYTSTTLGTTTTPAATF